MNKSYLYLSILFTVLTFILMLLACGWLLYDLYTFITSTKISINDLKMVFSGFSGLVIAALAMFTYLLSNLAKRRISPKYEDHGMVYFSIAVLFGFCVLIAFFNGYLTEEYFLLSTVILMTFIFIKIKVILKESRTSTAQLDKFLNDYKMFRKENKGQVDQFDLRNAPLSNELLQRTVDYLEKTKHFLFKPMVPFIPDYKAMIILSRNEGTAAYKILWPLTLLSTVSLLMSAAEFLKVLYYSHTYNHSLMFTLANFGSAICILQFSILLKTAYETILRACAEPIKDKLVYGCLIGLFFLWYSSVAAYIHAEDGLAGIYALLEILLYLVSSTLVASVLNKDVLIRYTPSKEQLQEAKKELKQ